MKIIIQITASPGSEQAVKESLAMYCEQFGDCRVVEIREDKVEQQTFLGGQNAR